MPSGPHLELMQRIVAPADEWKPDDCCWVTMRVAEGFGYCFQGCLVRELPAGHAVITGPGAEAVFRASQLGELRLEFFHVDPQRLTGLITAIEWRQLEQLYSQGTPLVFHYAPEDALARKFGRLAALQDRGSLQVRAAMLQSWASCVAEVLPPLGIPERKNLVILFRRFLSEISEKELATISITEMAAQLNSSERHLSRLFRTEFGMSLRDKQAELSLRRACDLLLDPRVTIRHAAFESGYRHMGLFNSTFKKRFGVTPKEWRRRHLSAKPDDACDIRENLPDGEKAGTRQMDSSDDKRASQPEVSSQDGVSVAGPRTALSQPDLPLTVSKMGCKCPAAEVAMVPKPGVQNGKTLGA